MERYRKQAVAAIKVERQRQIDGEGRSARWDDGYLDGELAAAGSAYLRSALGRRHPHDGDVPHEWPWSAGAWKPHSVERDAVRAGALMVAEIDRLRRLASRRLLHREQRFTAALLHADAVELLATIYRDRKEQSGRQEPAPAEAGAEPPRSSTPAPEAGGPGAAHSAQPSAAPDNGAKAPPFATTSAAAGAVPTSTGDCPHD